MTTYSAENVQPCIWLYHCPIKTDGWKGLSHKHCGLKNTGSNNVLNAVLQSLLHIPAFLDWLESEKDYVCSEKDECLTGAIIGLHLQMKTQEHIIPTRVFNVLQVLFKDISLQNLDPFDVLLRIFHHLDYEYKVHAGYSKNIMTSIPKLGTPLRLIFDGVLKCEGDCKRCGKKVYGYQEILCAVLPHSEEVSVQKSIDKWFYEQTTTECRASCVCGFMLHSWKNVAFQDPPYILTVKIGRFDIAGNRRSESPSISDTLVFHSTFKYKLIGGIFHDGVSKSNGHYFAAGFCPDGSLTLFNDSVIRKVPFMSLFTSGDFKSNIYILFYERQVETNKITVHVDETHITLERAKEGTTGSLVETAFKKKRKRCVIGKARRSNLINPMQRSPKFHDDITPVAITSTSPFKVNHLESTPSTHVDKAKAALQFMSKETISEKSIAHIGVQVSIPTAMFTYKKLQEQGPKKFKFFTGVSPTNFEALFQLMGGKKTISNLKIDYLDRTPCKRRVAPKISPHDRLLLTLIRLRRGTPLMDLGESFSINYSHAGDIFYAMIRHMYETFLTLKTSMFITADAQKKKKPLPFKPFKNLRVILDGMEIRIQKPSNFEQQGNTYSEYKRGNTVLFIIGISCHGSIIFISPGFEGSMSDKEATLQSGLLDLLQKGDTVMTDRGFDLVSELQQIGVDLIKPPHLGKRKCFTPAEEILTSAIASARIYVEHAIRKIKEYRLLRFQIPVAMLPLLPDIVYVCGCLANFKKPYISQKRRNKS